MVPSGTWYHFWPRMSPRGWHWMRMGMTGTLAACAMANAPFLKGPKPFSGERTAHHRALHHAIERRIGGEEEHRVDERGMVGDHDEGATGELALDGAGVELDEAEEPHVVGVKPQTAVEELAAAAHRFGGVAPMAEANDGENHPGEKRPAPPEDEESRPGEENPGEPGEVPADPDHFAGLPWPACSSKWAGSIHVS